MVVFKVKCQSIKYSVLFTAIYLPNISIYVQIEIDQRLNGCTICTFLLFAALQADKSLRLLAFLQNTLRSAADRINKSNFRGRCGTVNYHTLFKFIVIKGFPG